MKTEFRRADGVAVRIVPGFRRMVLAARPSGTPQEHWTDAEYGVAARRRLDDARRRQRDLHRFAPPGGLHRALEICCGMGVDCALAAAGGMDQILGIDRDLVALDPGPGGQRARRLVTEVLRLAGYEEAARDPFPTPRVEFRVMDATNLEIGDACMDVVWSRVALEHVKPVRRALKETARVLRPGGLAHHQIDPFFWLKGCHKRGLTDIPWAHARLAGEDFTLGVRAAETRGRSVVRSTWLQSLNALTLVGWRRELEAVEALELVEWRETRSPLAEKLLNEHPDVLPTALPGVTAADLTCSSIIAVLRRC